MFPGAPSRRMCADCRSSETARGRIAAATSAETPASSQSQPVLGIEERGGEHRGGAQHVGEDLEVRGVDVQAVAMGVPVRKKAHRDEVGGEREGGDSEHQTRVDGHGRGEPGGGLDQDPHAHDEEDLRVDERGEDLRAVEAECVAFPSAPVPRPSSPRTRGPARRGRRRGAPRRRAARGCETRCRPRSPPRGPRS